CAKRGIYYGYDDYFDYW
nr:immunoglobulin heavy chain junction region [Mus musculus]MBK4189362.1 immunoglobulin heavy chain junction region [Mus musculus]MBK4189363.1 immunoglobulin heavy chain junction region [Mus musculus]MBK4189365.1 immunoglobulin heavy chain junction region [Mus musculus]